MKIVVDRLLCDGNGLCVKEAPKHLAMGDDDLVHVFKEQVDESEREQARRAVAVCPKAALALID